MCGPGVQAGLSWAILLLQGASRGTQRALSEAPRRVPHKTSTPYCPSAPLSTWYLILLGPPCSLGFSQHGDLKVVILLSWQLSCKNKKEGNGRSCGLDLEIHAVLLQRYSICQQESPSSRGGHTGPSFFFNIPHDEDSVKADVAIFNSPRRERSIWTRKIRKCHTWKVVYKLVLKDMDHLKKMDWG